MLSDRLRVLYLHGFASSPGSRKARFFTKKLFDHGVRLEVPALDEGDFRNLTITRQLHVVERAVSGEPVVLIGSSLGGYLAALYAARNSNVQRLVLMAPAFRFHNLWTNDMDPAKLKNWKENGSIPVFHHLENQELPLGYQFIEDAAQYEPDPGVSQPCLIFHGTSDASVPIEYSAEFIHNHPNARLIPMNSGHELTDVLDQMWNESSAFILGVRR